MKLREKELTELQTILLARLEELLAKDQYQIVELNYIVHKRRARFHIVLFHPEGVSLEACEQWHRIINVEIERLCAGGLQIGSDYSLEISSPGTERSLNSSREFQVFSGQNICCLVGGAWHRGILLGLQGDYRSELVLQTNIQNAESTRFPLEQVLKVKLDSQQTGVQQEPV